MKDTLIDILKFTSFWMPNQAFQLFLVSGEMGILDNPVWSVVSCNNSVHLFAVVFFVKGLQVGDLVNPR